MGSMAKRMERETTVGRVLLNYWRGQKGHVLRPPASELMVHNFEQKYRVRMPLDLRDYFLKAADGFTRHWCGDQDVNGFHFWAMQDIQTVAEFVASEGNSAPNEWRKFFLFADYLQWCWGYAIRLDANSSVGGPVSLFCAASGESLQVADSFSEFVALYVRDDSKLYPAS